MTEPADLTHAVLLRVAEFLRKLPADQLRDLADGEAKLEVVPKGGRAPVRTRSARTAPARPAVSTDQIRADLAAIADTASARQYLDGLGLTVPQIRALAKELSITVPGKATKEVALQTIVRWTVGRRLDAESISRPGPALG